VNRPPDAWLGALFHLTRFLERFEAPHAQFLREQYELLTSNTASESAKASSRNKIRANLSGGMGSLGDVYLCETNGNPVPEIDREVVNAEFDRLRRALGDALRELVEDS